MKKIYDIFMVPLEKKGLNKARKVVIPKAEGTVLEIGIGTLVNLHHYQLDKIEKLVLTDKKIKTKYRPDTKKVEVKEINVEQLPFDDNTFDYVVHTLVFCSVKNPVIGIKEINRVLKENGSILFLEHVLPEKKGLRRFFKIINPFWKKVASNCHLTRDYKTLIEENGFEIIEFKRIMNTVFVFGEAKKEKVV